MRSCDLCIKVACSLLFVFGFGVGTGEKMRAGRVMGFLCCFLGLSKKTKKKKEGKSKK